MIKMVARRMVMSSSASDEVTQRLNKTWHDIEKAKKGKRWNDDVSSMQSALDQEGIQIAVLEVFSRPRVNGMAERLKMIPGASLDLTGLDPDDNQPWDFSNPKKRAKAIDLVASKESLLVIGSPMCKAFSRWQN